MALFIVANGGSSAFEYEEKKEKNYIWERSEILHPAITNPIHGSKCCLASASEVLASIADNEIIHAVKNSYS